MLQHAQNGCCVEAAKKVAKQMSDTPEDESRSLSIAQHQQVARLQHCKPGNIALHGALG